MNEQPVEDSQQPSILSFVKDVPNLCSLAGLLCALLAMNFTVLQNYPAAMIGLLWAVLFDWFDGRIGRRMKNRTDVQRTFGMQLDSLIDMVSFGACPALLLLSYGDFNPWFLPGAFVILLATVLRLSYFNLYGLDSKSTYMGLAADNNVIIFTFLFLFEGWITPAVFAPLFYAISLLLAVLNIVPIRTPKLTGRWVYAITLYVVILTAVFSYQLMS
jgi:CDP-diacylglycerol--serine O-phosphatidyltransferase